MADAIRRLIHHEKQEKGSNLCAQHAINSILQGNYFSATDLAAIAQELDELEASHRSQDAAPTESVNMDDSGFFSVQVLDRALLVWGLTLVRWRSEELAAFHDDPDTQQAFVLNLDAHWFTLRRFGVHGGNGHWFNLNSFFDAPEPIGKLYLGMVLQQAETEGYSVFAVRPAPGAESSVPPCEADEVASTIPEGELQSFTGSGASQAQGISAAGVAGFDDDDLEFQKALEMSLLENSGHGPASGSGSGSGSGIIPPAAAAPRGGASFASSFDFPGAYPGARSAAARPDAPMDFEQGMQASAARAKALLEQAKREQMMAEEEGGFAQARRRADASDEEEQMRLAIEESLKGTTSAPRAPIVEDDDDDDDYRMDEDEEDDDDYVPPTPSVRPSLPGTRSSNTHSLPTSSHSIPRPPANPGTRVIDDEDAELQAALKASLEGLPADFVVPPTPPRRLIHTSHPVTPPNKPPTVVEEGDEDDEEEDDEGEEAAGSGKGKERAKSPVEERLDVDEMRRRRLARFGGS